MINYLTDEAAYQLAQYIGLEPEKIIPVDDITNEDVEQFIMGIECSACAKIEILEGDHIYHCQIYDILSNTQMIEESANTRKVAVLKAGLEAMNRGWFDD